MPQIENCCLVVVDVQGRLAELMHDKETLFKNICILIKAAKILEIPIIWCQQVPKALGETVEKIKELLTDLEPVNKSAFSCLGEKKFTEELKELNRKQVILCGIETHVCIYQTAMDLIKGGYEVDLIADAVSSRTATNKQIAIEKLRTNQVNISSTEMVLFEMMGSCEHPRFREVAKLVK